MVKMSVTNLNIAKEADLVTKMSYVIIRERCTIYSLLTIQM